MLAMHRRQQHNDPIPLDRAPLAGGARILQLLLVFWLYLLWPMSAVAVQDPSPKGPAIVVGGDRDYPPYEFIDKNGQPNGYNVELTRAIAEVMGMQVEFRLGGWSEMRAALQAGKIDVLQGMSYSEERATEVDFSLPC